MRRAESAGFSPLVMIALILVGVISLAGLGLLAAFEPELRSGDDGQGHALSRSAVGYAGIVRLLQRTGTPVVLARGPLSAAADEGLLVLTPQLMTDPARIVDMEHGGPVLVVLPKWQAAPDWRHRGWVRTVGAFDGDLIVRLLPKAWSEGLALRRSKDARAVTLSRPNGEIFAELPKVEQLQVLSGPGWIPVLSDQSGGMVLAMHQQSHVYVLSDPDLLDNLGMKSLQGAEAGIRLLALIRAPDTPVVFDLTLHGFERSLNPLRLALEPPLLGATLCLLGALLLAAVQAAVRFGPARPAGRTLALGKRALADNTAGLVRLARREHRMAAPYADMIRAEVALAVGAPRGLEGAELDGLLERLGAARGTSASFAALAERARVARNPSDLMQVASELYRWRLEMIRERH